jgi:lipopolysaccharide transport system permease protein
MIFENDETGWTLEIKPRGSLFHVVLREIWQYRDLLEMYIKWEIVTFYEQTILGPLWFFRMNLVAKCH